MNNILVMVTLAHVKSSVVVILVFAVQWWDIRDVHG